MAAQEHELLCAVHLLKNEMALIEEKPTQEHKLWGTVEEVKDLLENEVVVKAMKEKDVPLWRAQEAV